MLRRLVDTHTPNTLANRLRRKRFAVFKSLMDSVPRPCRILDVGGYQSFWANMGMLQEPGVEVWVLNLGPVTSNYPNVRCIVGDARDMGEFREGEFDVVFSNSVLEHVGGLADQMQMAREVRRVGQRYFLQTPNRYFPIEPHYLIPFFQFMPRWTQRLLASRVRLGWFGQASLERIRLVSRGELKAMFPDANILAEKFAMLNKSFMVYAGWEPAGTEGEKDGARQAGRDAPQPDVSGQA